MLADLRARELGPRNRRTARQRSTRVETLPCALADCRRWHGLANGCAAAVRLRCRAGTATAWSRFGDRPRAAGERLPLAGVPVAIKDNMCLAGTHTTAGSKILVIVTLYGGNDGLNTVIPYADPAYLGGRPDLGYQPHEVITLDHELGLRASLSDALERQGERLQITYRNRYGRTRSYATKFEGIVKVEGDLLTLCIVMDGQGTRPTEFASPPQTQVALLQLMRAKK